MDGDDIAMQQYMDSDGIVCVGGLGMDRPDKNLVFVLPHEFRIFGDAHTSLVVWCWFGDLNGGPPLQGVPGYQIYHTNILRSMWTVKVSRSSSRCSLLVARFPVSCALQPLLLVSRHGQNLANMDGTVCAVR